MGSGGSCEGTHRGGSHGIGSLITPGESTHHGKFQFLLIKWGPRKGGDHVPQEACLYVANWYSIGDRFLWPPKRMKLLQAVYHPTSASVFQWKAWKCCCAFLSTSDATQQNRNMHLHRSCRWRRNYVLVCAFRRTTRHGIIQNHDKRSAENCGPSETAVNNKLQTYRRYYK